MVKRCVNPKCTQEFQHLHCGDLYALDSGSEDTKFLWLCSDCAPSLALSVDAAGGVELRERCAGLRTAPANSRTRLRLIASYLEPEKTAAAPNVQQSSRLMRVTAEAA